jgi:segregation and condensation protein B
MASATVVVIAAANDDPPPHNAAERHRQALRMAEALLFAAGEPMLAEEIAARLPPEVDVPALLGELSQDYAMRGVNLVQVAGKWMFRTAGDLAFLLSRETVEQRRLSRAALETLAIIAYHQPVTRADIEAIRGVVAGRGTLDVLLETGWIKMRGRRRAPGRPVTYGTTEAFLTHFGLDSVADLPGLDELRAAGLLDPRAPTDLAVPEPRAGEALMPDEDPLDEDPAALSARDLGDEG